MHDRLLPGVQLAVMLDIVKVRILPCDYELDISFQSYISQFWLCGFVLYRNLSPQNEFEC